MLAFENYLAAQIEAGMTPEVETVVQVAEFENAYVAIHQNTIEDNFDCVVFWKPNKTQPSGDFEGMPRYSGTLHGARTAFGLSCRDFVKL